MLIGYNNLRIKPKLIKTCKVLCVRAEIKNMMVHNTVGMTIAHPIR